MNTDQSREVRNLAASLVIPQSMAANIASPSEAATAESSKLIQGSSQSQTQPSYSASSLVPETSGGPPNTIVPQGSSQSLSSSQIEDQRFSCM